MSHVKVEFNFVTTLNQKEFSVVTRSLAGHQLTPDDLVVARDLNMRLLTLRVQQLKHYQTSSLRAPEVAECERVGILSHALAGSNQGVVGTASTEAVAGGVQ